MDARRAGSAVSCFFLLASRPELDGSSTYGIRVAPDVLSKTMDVGKHHYRQGLCLAEGSMHGHEH
jgi:hypothetical protein